MTTTFDPDKYAFFYGCRTGQFKYMSNYFASKFTMSHECIGRPGDAFMYPSAEHAIMHLKACLMDNDEVADKILSARMGPAAVKKLGRKVTPWDQEKWDSKVEEIAYAVVLAKFRYNEVLSQKLRGTKDKILAEASPKDKIWGIGISVAKAKNGGDWNGRNLLGETLMKVRAAM